MGVKGYKDLLKERKANYKTLQTRLGECAQKHGEHLLSTPHNGISMGKLLISVLDSELFFLDKEMIWMENWNMKNYIYVYVAF